MFVFYWPVKTSPKDNIFEGIVHASEPTNGEAFIVSYFISTLVL